MAADRESALISDYFKDEHPVILNLLLSIVENAGTVPVTLCGELAAKHESLSAVLQRGISSLSIAPPSIPKIKDAVLSVFQKRKKNEHRADIFNKPL